MGGLFEFVFGELLFWEVAEGGVRVFGGVLVFPGFVRFVVLPAEDILELVLAWVTQGVHWICEARLSRRRELAIELCCSLGSINRSYKLIY